MTAYFIGIAVCLCLSAFFSGSEMAFSSCNTIRLEGKRDEGDKKASLALKITEGFEDALGAILIGNNLVNISASSIGTLIVVALLGAQYNWVSTLVVTVVFIIFGETAPKIIAKSKATSAAMTLAYPVRFFMIIFMPVNKLAVGLVHLISLPFKGESTQDADEAVEELQSIIEQAEDEEVIDENRSEIIKAAIDFEEICAFEVMTSRVDLFAIDINDPIEEIERTAIESEYARIPVYEDSVDNIIGILYINHLLKAMTENLTVDIRELMMKPLYAYKTMKLPKLMQRFKEERQHMAVIVDEYGGTLGIVTMEDVLEELVGDIWDETDEVEPEVTVRSENEFELDGDMAISDFLELLDISEEEFEADSDTVGGWTVESFEGEFPSVGDSFEYGNFTVTVNAMDGMRVESVTVTRKPEEKEE